MRSVLVVAEIACAVALVVGASLLIRSLVALGRVDLGYSPERLLVVESSVPAHDLVTSRAATRFYGDALERIVGVPGVVSAAAVRGLPGTSFHSNGGYWLEGGPGPDATGVRSPQAVFTVTTPDYFRTMAIPVRRGRDLPRATATMARASPSSTRRLHVRAFQTSTRSGGESSVGSTRSTS